MAWLSRRKKWRLLDRIDGKIVTVIRNLGIHKGYADIAKVSYGKALDQGFSFTPPTSLAAIEGFLKAKRDGTEYQHQGRRLPIEEMCDLFLTLHGPSLKGRVSDHYLSNYYGLALRMKQVKKFWPGKSADEIGKLDVRDFLSQFKTIGTRMRWIGVLGKMFKFFKELNEEGASGIGGLVRLPKYNPVTKWRVEMKPHEKLELPDFRVLSLEEWARFRKFLKTRTLAICEIALKRFLRKEDIRKISHLKIVNGEIRGLQEKTGQPFRVPIMASQPSAYNFTNFKRDFDMAQVAADMNWPSEHPLHFSFKDLRRTGATWAYQETKDLVGISQMLGHRSIKTTIRYLNITQSDITRIAKAVDHLADKQSVLSKWCSTGVADSKSPSIPMGSMY